MEKSDKIFIDSKDFLVRTAVMKEFEGRDVPLEWIEHGLKSAFIIIRVLALEACQNRNVPQKWIERGLEDRAAPVRAAAMKVCYNRNIPVNNTGLEAGEFSHGMLNYHYGEKYGK